MPTQARCATCASPSATPARRRSCFRSGESSPAGRPRSTPAGSPRLRPRSTCPRTRRPRSQSEGLCRGGRSGFGRRQAAALAFATVPDAPAATRNFRALGVRPHPCHSTALAAARAADRAKILDPTCAPRRQRARPIDPSWPAAGAIALAAAALDLAAELAAARHSDRRRAHTPRRNRPRKSSTSCLPKIPSRPLKPLVTRP